MKNTQKYKNIYRISSIRLKGWDYASPGYYFVTICTKNRVPWFGKIVFGEIILSRRGEIAIEELDKTGISRPYVEIDAKVIMPNHIHAIIVIREIAQASVETFRRNVSTKKRLFPGTVGAIINQYKSVCTKRIRALNYLDFAWQAGYYDHIIRSEKSLEEIRAYILGKPIKWEEDEYFYKG